MKHCHVCLWEQQSSCVERIAGKVLEPPVTVSHLLSYFL